MATSAQSDAETSVDDLLRRAQGLFDRASTLERHDPEFVAWYFEAATFVKEHTPDLSRGFVDSFSLKGPRVGEAGEDANSFIRQVQFETRAAGLSSSLGLLRLVKKRLAERPSRDPRVDQLLLLGHELRDLATQSVFSLQELATRLWISPAANLQLSGPTSPVEIIGLAVDDACAARVQLLNMISKVSEGDIRALVANVSGAVRTFELALGLVLDGFTAAHDVDASMMSLYDEVCSRHQSFVDRFEAFARTLNNPICLARPKRLDTLRLGAGLAPPESVTFAVGQRKEALVAVRKILATASHHVLFVDGYVDPDFLSLLDDNLAALTVDVLTTVRGLAQSPSFKVIAAAHNQQHTGKIAIRTTTEVHDRYLVIDGKDIRHLGASLKNAGGKVWSMRRLPESEAVNVRTNILPPIWSAALIEL